MSNQEGTFRNTPPHHIGVVVKDIEKAIAHLEALGFGPFKVDDEHKVLEISFKGELEGKPVEWKTKISNANLGPVELELLEPTVGDQALRRSLEACGEGIHHVGWLTSDLQGDIAREKAKGARVWTSAFPEGMPGFCYFEGTDEGGMVVELREP